MCIPFLGKYHWPVSGRSCQTCTPRSWDGFYPEELAPLGFRDASRLTEADTRFRGWLVRRICGFLAAWQWEIPAESPGELLQRICSSRRVQDAASSPEPGPRGDEGSQQSCKEEICQILGEIQAPLSPLLLRSGGSRGNSLGDGERSLWGDARGSVGWVPGIGFGVFWDFEGMHVDSLSGFLGSFWGM
uniref:GPAT2 acyltransferase n=1 Tax=Junco hyemalis TaxID=40217 RepID=A0A8C5IY07_JUNHY